MYHPYVQHREKISVTAFVPFEDQLGGASLYWHWVRLPLANRVQLVLSLGFLS